MREPSAIEDDKGLIRARGLRVESTSGHFLPRSSFSLQEEIEIGICQPSELGEYFTHRGTFTVHPMKVGRGQDGDFNGVGPEYLEVVVARGEGLTWWDPDL